MRANWSRLAGARLRLVKLVESRSEPARSQDSPFSAKLSLRSRLSAKSTLLNVLAFAEARLNARQLEDTSGSKVWNCRNWSSRDPNPRGLRTADLRPSRLLDLEFPL